VKEQEKEKKEQNKGKKSFFIHVLSSVSNNVQNKIQQ
jgi:hypothetical protein